MLLRWSPTCKTNWTAHETINPFQCQTMTVARKAVTGIPADSDSFNYCVGINPSSASFGWTNMLYAKDAKAQACVTVQPVLGNSFNVCTAWV